MELIQIGRNQVELPIFADGIILCLKDPNDPTGST